MANNDRTANMAQEIRENPAQFLREALKHEGFLADTEFKRHAEAGKPFIMRLEEAGLLYLEIDYWRAMPAGGLMLNAHYQTIYHDGVPWSVVTEGEISDMAQCIWENDAASILTRRGTRKASWLFPKGIHNQPGCEETILHASNY